MLRERPLRGVFGRRALLLVVHWDSRWATHNPGALCRSAAARQALGGEHLLVPTVYDRCVNQNERVVRDFYDRFNAGDVEGAAGQYAEQCEWDFPAFNHACRTRAEVLDVCQSWKAAFPDGRVDVVNAISCGDVVVVEWDSQGTWTGPLGAAAGEPNGKRFHRRGCAVTEVQAGKIVQCHDYFDRANMYEPLGLMHLVTA